LAPQAAIKHFRHFCEGRLFQLWTDHKPLVTALSCVLTPISPRQQRHLAFISEFNVQLLYLPGLKNVVADFMSRPSPPPPLELSPPRRRQIQWISRRWPPSKNRCPETQRLLGGTSLKLAFRQTGAQPLSGDISTGTFRPIVPLKFRKDIFAHFHNVAYPGRLSPRRIISSRFVWRGLSSDVTAWARGCLACQWGKIHRRTRLAPQPIPIPQ
jgi:hypothetical protein